MTKNRLFRPDFLSCMTSRSVIFSERGGECASLETAIICRSKISALSNVFFRKKNIIIEHKKSLFPHTWYHESRFNHAVIDYPYRGARGAR
jgi:hypothetical protein